MPERIKPCSILIDYEVDKAPEAQQVSRLLEKGSEEEKIDALKTLILMIMHDDTFPRMMMTVVQHCLKEDSKEIKKLLVIYWEILEKTNAEGKLKEEMILLCNALLQDLKSPNEFVRGRTLRLVSRLMHKEMLDSLIHPVIDCLSHKHPYVRRNAVMCVYSIHKVFGEEIVADAHQEMLALLDTETDLSTKRNVLLYLFEADPEASMRYINRSLVESEENSLAGNADILQLVVLEQLKKVSKVNPLEKGKYIKAIFTIADTAKSQSVLFESAVAILQLTSMPLPVKHAISTLLKLLNDQSADNNTKLIVLERLGDLKSSFAKLLQEQVVDVLRVLATPSDAIRDKALQLALSLLTQRNIDDIVRILKKSLQGLYGEKTEHAYRSMLVHALHHCAISFPEVTGQHGLVDVLVDCCLDEKTEGTAGEVALFLQMLMQTYASLRPAILEKLEMCLGEIATPQVLRTTLWILSEYTTTPQRTLDDILRAMGEGPYLHKRETFQQAEETQVAEGLVHRTVVLPDGSYGTQLIARSELNKKVGHTTGLRRLLTENDEVDFILVSSLAVAVTKLALKVEEGREELNKRLILLFGTLVQLKSYPCKYAPSSPNRDKGVCETGQGIDPDNYDRVCLCVLILLGQAPEDLLKDGLKYYAFTKSGAQSVQTVKETATAPISSQPDDLLMIKQLKGKEGLGDIDFAEDEGVKASSLMQSEDLDLSTRLAKTRQLTGLGDPAFVECFVRVHQYDIVLEFTVSNRTASTLKNLTLELATQGDLKLVDRPQPCNIGVGQSKLLKATLKVSSSDAGVIFGNLTYDNTAGGLGCMLTLNEVPIDVSEYISPHPCEDTDFRRLWGSLNWESVVDFTFQVNSVAQLLELLASRTNMQSVTAQSVLDSCDSFVVCNFYARSRFGEDNLMNVSAEIREGIATGQVRIRAKSQGMTTGLAEKLSSLKKDLLARR
jgi:coatomer subunit beta